MLNAIDATVTEEIVVSCFHKYICLPLSAGKIIPKTVVVRGVINFISFINVTISENTSFHSLNNKYLMLSSNG